MNKIKLFIVIFVVIVLFASADYFLNIHDTFVSDYIPSIPVQDQNIINESEFNFTEYILSLDQSTGYIVQKRERTKEIFEKFDLSSVSNVRIYRNTLVRGNSGDDDIIVIYEIQGEEKQGQLNYVDIKLKIAEQIEATGNINEVGEFGYNSFFYNDLNNGNTGFMIAQIKDNIFAFQYNKANEESFETVKDFVEKLMFL